jgi:hypothetical protein
MFKHFELLYFIIGLLIGAIILYTYTPDKKEVVKYPLPDNVAKLVYKDQNGTCYKFKAKEVNCEQFADKITSYPIQS